MVSSTMLKLRVFGEAFDRRAPIEHLELFDCFSFALFDFLPMPQRLDVNPITEHSLYLRLFVTNSGGV